jgi:hypothetical protein
MRVPLICKVCVGVRGAGQVPAAMNIGQVGQRTTERVLLGALRNVPGLLLAFVWT